MPPLTTTKGVETKAVYGLSQMLLRIAREQSPSHICVVYDAPGRSFRTQVYAEYKAQRPPTPRPLVSQFQRVREIADALNIAIYEVDGFEADDVLGTLSLQAGRLGLETIIVTGDLDTLVALSHRVGVLAQQTLVTIGPLAEVARNEHPFVQNFFHGERGRRSETVRRTTGIPIRPATWEALRVLARKLAIDLPPSLPERN